MLRCPWVLQTFLEEILKEFPTFRIVHKDRDGLSRAIDLGLRVVTLGRMTEYQTHYHTVIGNTLYVPRCWDSTPEVDRVITLRHERVHLRQRKRLSLPLMAFSYFIPILPLGLAYGRARIEWEAYAESLRATAELKGLAAARDPSFRAELLRRFTSADYGWMWPFPRQVGRWIDQELDDIERIERQTRDSDKDEYAAEHA